jgi:hypothetical protein
MKVWSVLSLLAAAILLTVSAGIQSHAQIGGERIIVDLPREVVVGEKVLAPGSYELHRDASHVNPVVKIYNNDQMQHETAVLPIKAEANDVIDDSKVILEKVGDNYYMTKIWISGQKTGYEIPLPERARNLKRELEEPLEARVEPLKSTEPEKTAANVAEPLDPARPPDPPNAAAADPGPGLKFLLDQEAERQEQEARNNQVAQLDQSEVERISPGEARQSRIESQQPQTERPADRSLDSAQADSQDAANRELPATSANWLQFALLGASLIALSALVKWGW